MNRIQEIPNLDEMSKEEFDSLLQKGYDQIERGEGIPLKEAFDQIREEARGKALKLAK